MSKAYVEIMERIEVTKEMRERVICRAEEAVYGNTGREAVRKAKKVTRRRKYLAAAACVMLVIMGAAVIPNLQGPWQDTQNGNPVAECGSVSELAEKAGFPVSEVSGLPFNISGEKYSLTDGIAEIEYTGSNNETAVFRKSAGSEDNQVSRPIMIRPSRHSEYGKTKTTLKGSGNNRNSRHDQRGVYSYSVVCRRLFLKKMEKIVRCRYSGIDPKPA